MFNYNVYKKIKSRLQAVESCFMFLGQYLKGKDNTSYIVPAIYIEMPKTNNLVFYGRKQLAAKDAMIRIHYISNAPFKSHAPAIQDSALANHDNKLEEINDLLQGWNAENEDGSLLTQQLIPVGSAEVNFFGTHVVSILTYKTEMYRKPKPLPEAP